MCWLDALSAVLGAGGYEITLCAASMADLRLAICTAAHCESRGARREHTAREEGMSGTSMSFRERWAELCYRFVALRGADRKGMISWHEAGTWVVESLCPPYFLCPFPPNTSPEGGLRARVVHRGVAEHDSEQGAWEGMQGRGRNDWENAEKKVKNATADRPGGALGMTDGEE